MNAVKDAAQRELQSMHRYHTRCRCRGFTSGAEDGPKVDGKGKLGIRFKSSEEHHNIRFSILDHID